MLTSSCLGQLESPKALVLIRTAHPHSSCRHTHIQAARVSTACVSMTPHTERNAPNNQRALSNILPREQACNLTYQVSCPYHLCDTPSKWAQFN